MHGEDLVADDIGAWLEALGDCVGVAVVAGLGQGVRGPGAVGVLAVLGNLEPDGVFAWEVLGAVWILIQLMVLGMKHIAFARLTTRAARHVGHDGTIVAGRPQCPVQGHIRARSCFRRQGGRLRARLTALAVATALNVDEGHVGHGPVALDGAGDTLLLQVISSITTAQK